MLTQRARSKGEKEGEREQIHFKLGASEAKGQILFLVAVEWHGMKRNEKKS